MREMKGWDVEERKSIITMTRLFTLIKMSSRQIIIFEFQHYDHFTLMK